MEEPLPNTLRLPLTLHLSCQVLKCTLRQKERAEAVRPRPVLLFLLCSSLTSGSGLVDLLLARHRGSTANRKVGADVLLLDLLDVRGELEGAARVL